MNEIPTVLAAVDDGDASLGAFRFAKYFARESDGGKLYAGHVVPAVPVEMESLLFPYACFGDDYDEVRVDLVKAASKRMVRRLKDYVSGSASGVLRVSYGRPADGLLELVAHMGPDVLVVGHGSRPGALGVLGPVASELARRSPVPVVVAKGRSSEPSVRRLLAATDLTPESAQVMARALVLAHHFDGKVQPVVVLPRASSMDHVGALGDARRGSTRPKKELSRLWTQLQESLELPFPLATALKERLRKPIFTTGCPGERVVEIAAELEADLIVIGRCRNDGGSGMRLGRVAEFVARHASPDVLLLPWVEQDEATR